MINEFRGKYLCLSNFFPFCGSQTVPVEPPAPILWKGQIYLTREHLYQASKTTNLLEVARIRCAPSPALAKALGKRCTLRPGFAAMQLDIMEQIVAAQFVQHPYLALRLLRTQDQELLEGNRWGDTFWGVDLRTQPAQGLNHLGKIHMKIRKLLQRETLTQSPYRLTHPREQVWRAAPTNPALP